jgi:hypothetical protein
MATQRQHGKPRGRSQRVFTPAQRAAHDARVRRQKDARKLATLTPEQRAHFRV